MRCRKCNAEIAIGVYFCTVCGTPIKKEEEKPNTGYKIKKPKENRNMSLSKKAKISIGILLGIILILLATIGTFRYLNSATRVVEKFKNSIVENDIKTLSKIIESNDLRLQIDEESLEPFIQSFNNKPSLLNTTVDLLLASENGEKRNLTNASDNNVLKLKKKDLFLLGSKYYIEVVPVYIRVNSRYNDVIVSLNDKNVLTTGKDRKTYEVGPFMPADYIFTAFGKSYDNSAKENQSLLFLSENIGAVKEVTALNDFREVKIYSNMMDATIYINGENTGFKINEYEKLGLVKNNSTVTAAITSSTGTFRSNTVSVKSDTIDLRFDNVSRITNAPDTYITVDVLEKEVKSVVEDYINHFEGAVNYNDFSYIREYLYYNSNIYNTQLKYIDDTYKNGVKVSFAGCNITKVALSEDKSTAEVYVTETFRVSKNDSVSTIVNNWIYSLRFNPITKKYQLTDIVKQ